MDQINGNHRAFENMQRRAQQDFGEFVTRFLNEAMLSGRYLQAGYKGTVIFSHQANPNGDIILSNANLNEVFEVLRRRMTAAGIPTPVMHSGATAPTAQSNDIMQVVNLAAAIRRALMFVTGDTVVATILRKALQENQDTARNIVAGYISTFPVLADKEPEAALHFLDCLSRAGDVVFLDEPGDKPQEPEGPEVPQPGSEAHDRGDVWNDTKRQWEPKQ